MNQNIIATVITTNATSTATTTGTQQIITHCNDNNIEMIDCDATPAPMYDDDDDDEMPSSPESAYNENDIKNVMDDDVTAQLAAAGPVGVAAAAAIASAKKKKRPHSFETNPSIRKRQQNRLLRKLRQTIFEFATRVGQQAVVLVATPGKPTTSYKVFGAKPLEDVVKNLKNIVMEELETALAQHAPPPQTDDPTLFELPPLIIDGIPTPVEKMTQAQLRAFIPLMLKYSTGRGKPGWGRESTRPNWWPKELPWANVRMDARTEDDKQKISWTHALRKIVVNCYKYHGREDLLPAFTEEDEKANQLATLNSTITSGSGATGTVGLLKVLSNSAMAASGTSASIALSSSTMSSMANTTTSTTSSTSMVSINSPNKMHIQSSSSSSPSTTTHHLANTQFGQAMLHSIQNADGSVSIIQVDPNSQIITLPDGTTAQVQGVATLHTTQGEGGTVHTVQGIDSNGHENMTVDLSEALNQEGQIIITGEDVQGFPVAVSGMLTLNPSVFQTMITNIQQLHTNSDGSVCFTPMQIENGDGIETIQMAPGVHQMMIQGPPGTEPQVLQLLTIKDPSVLKALSNMTEVKSEESLME